MLVAEICDVVCQWHSKEMVQFHCGPASLHQYDATTQRRYITMTQWPSDITPPQPSDAITPGHHCYLWTIKWEVTGIDVPTMGGTVVRPTLNSRKRPTDTIQTQEPPSQHNTDQRAPTTRQQDSDTKTTRHDERQKHENIYAMLLPHRDVPMLYSCHVMSCSLSHVMPCHVTARHTHHITSCYFMSRHAVIHVVFMSCRQCVMSHSCHVVPTLCRLHVMLSLSHVVLMSCSLHVISSSCHVVIL